MNMPGVQERPSAGGNKGDPAVDGKAHVPMHITPTPDQAKHWMKAHRTMIASGASSIFSTLSAVSLDRRGWKIIKRVVG